MSEFNRDIVLEGIGPHLINDDKLYHRVMLANKLWYSCLRFGIGFIAQYMQEFSFIYPPELVRPNLLRLKTEDVYPFVTACRKIVSVAKQSEANFSRLENYFRGLLKKGYQDSVLIQLMLSLLHRHRYEYYLSKQERTYADQSKKISQRFAEKIQDKCSNAKLVLAGFRFSASEDGAFAYFKEAIADFDTNKALAEIKTRREFSERKRITKDQFLQLLDPVVLFNLLKVLSLEELFEFRAVIFKALVQERNFLDVAYLRSIKKLYSEQNISFAALDTMHPKKAKLLFDSDQKINFTLPLVTSVFLKIHLNKYAYQYLRFLGHYYKPEMDKYHEKTLSIFGLELQENKNNSVSGFDLPFSAEALSVLINEGFIDQLEIIRATVSDEDKKFVKDALSAMLFSFSYKLNNNFEDFKKILNGLVSLAADKNKLLYWIALIDHVLRVDACQFNEYLRVWSAYPFEKKIQAIETMQNLLALEVFSETDDKLCFMQPLFHVFGDSIQEEIGKDLHLYKILQKVFGRDEAVKLETNFFYKLRQFFANNFAFFLLTLGQQSALLLGLKTNLSFNAAEQWICKYHEYNERLVNERLAAAANALNPASGQGTPFLFWQQATQVTTLSVTQPSPAIQVLQNPGIPPTHY
jgi:hypothetical protein